MKIPFNFVVPTVYGMMIVNRNDINQTNALVKTGRSPDHEEIVLLSKVLAALGTNLTVIDIGAHLGTFAMGLAGSVGPQGKVHAFEPQRIIFNMLAGSVSLNSLLNVHCYNMALGNRQGKIEIPQFDYGKPLNFGSIEFADEQREQLLQPRSHDPERAEYVPLTTLDALEFEQVHLLKIDVEGMELSVLEGAEATIRRCRPVMFIERLKSERVALREKIVNFGYVVYENPLNYLCVPTESRDWIRVNAGKVEVTLRDDSRKLQTPTA